jgi:hypothetical protein
VTRGRFTVAFALAVLGVAAPAGASQPKTLRIAYSTGTATAGPFVWVAAASGHGARKLGVGDEPLISPSGAYVAAGGNTSKGPALELYSAAGGARHSFFNAATVSATAVAWSSDSRYLAVQLSSTQLKSSHDGLAVIDTDTMRATTIVTGGMLAGASFNPASSGGDRLVYGIFGSSVPVAPSNLFTVAPTGADSSQLTHDNHSLDPLWTAEGIVFVRQTPRGKEAYPLNQLWLRAGSRLTQLTHIPVEKLAAGLVPLSASRSGNRILAEFVGEDTSDAWSVQVSPRRVRQVSAGASKFIQGAAISNDGTHLLVDVGAFQGPASRGSVESVPFGGGMPVVLARGAEPSWNG